MRMDMTSDIIALTNVMNEVVSHYEKAGKVKKVSKTWLEAALFPVANGDEKRINRLVSGKETITDNTLNELARSENSWEQLLLSERVHLHSTAEENMFKKELHDAVVQFVESKYPAMYELRTLSSEQIVTVYLITRLCAHQLLRYDANEKQNKRYIEEQSIEWQKASFNRATLVQRKINITPLIDYLSKEEDCQAFIICGGAESGKRTLVKDCLYERREAVLILDGSAQSTDEMIESIYPKAYMFLRKMPNLKLPAEAGSYYPYSSKDKKHIIRESIKTVHEKPLLVIKDFCESDEELDKLEEFCLEARLKLVITSNQHFTRHKNSRSIPPFSAKELEQIFYRINPIESVSEEDRIKVNKLSVDVRGHPDFMKMIAKWYQAQIKKKKNIPGEALQELLDSIDKDDLEQLKTDITFRTNSKASDKKLAGHIYSWAMDRLSSNAKSTYLILSCFDGYPVRCSDLERWLKLSPQEIQELVDNGLADYCDDHTEHIRVRIPKIMANLAFHSEDERRSKEEWSIIQAFAAKFVREIRHEEYGLINPWLIAIIMEKVLKLLVVRRKYMAGQKYLEEIQVFFMSCIRYHIMMCRRDLAKKLYDRYWEKLELDDSDASIHYLKFWMEEDPASIVHMITNLEDSYLRRYSEKSDMERAETPQTELEAMREMVLINLDYIWTGLEWNRGDLQTDYRRCQFGTHEYMRRIIYAAPYGLLENYAQLLNMLNTDARRRLPPFLEKATERYRYQIRVVKQAEVLQMQGKFFTLPAELNRAIDEYLSFAGYMATLKPKSRLGVMSLIRMLIDEIFVLSFALPSIPNSSLRSSVIDRMGQCNCSLEEVWKENPSVIAPDLRLKRDSVISFYDNTIDLLSAHN